MTNKRLTALTIISMAVVLAAACSFSFSTASIAEAKMAKGATETLEPVDPTSVFETTDSTIHCLVVLGSAPEGTRVKAVWTAVNAEGQTPNKQFGETEVEGGGAKNKLQFTYTPPAAGLPVGEYKVDIYLNPEAGKVEPPARTVTFSVKAGRPMIAQVTLSESENGSPVTGFPADTSAFYCTVDVRGASAGTKVSAGWVAVEAGDFELNRELRRADIILEAGQNQANFNLTSGQAFPPGSYRVDIYLGDSSSADRSVTFTVAE